MCHLLDEIMCIDSIDQEWLVTMVLPHSANRQSDHRPVNALVAQ